MRDLPYASPGPEHTRQGPYSGCENTDTCSMLFRLRSCPGVHLETATLSFLFVIATQMGAHKYKKDSQMYICVCVLFFIFWRVHFWCSKSIRDNFFLFSCC